MPKYDSQYYSTYQQLRPKPYIMDRLTMLTQREQLMEDIDAIVDEFTFDLPIDDIQERSQLAEDLTRTLCDAVCKNFPV